jgi:integrase
VVIRWLTGRAPLAARPRGRITSKPDPITGRPIPLTSEQAAREVLMSVRAAYASGRTLDAAIAAFMRSRAPENMVPARVASWLVRRRENCGAGDISPTYLRDLERYARAPGYFPWWREVAVWEVTFGGLEDWSRSLAAQGLSPATRRKVLGAFRSFLTDLRRRGEIDAVPEFPSIPLGEYLPRTTTLDEQEKIIAAIPKSRRGAFLAARLGVRPGEARALNVSDYDFATGTLTIAAAMKGPCSSAPRRTTKERNARRIIVDAELREWIAEFVDPAGALTASPLFVNRPAGKTAAAGSGTRCERSGTARHVCLGSP